MFVIFTGSLVSGETFLFPCYLETLRCIKNCVISFNLNVDFKKPFLPFLGKAFPRTYVLSCKNWCNYNTDYIRNRVCYWLAASLRASSPIWASETSLARTRERAAKPRGEGQRKGELATISHKISFVLRPDEGKYNWLKNDVPEIKVDW